MYLEKQIINSMTYDLYMTSIALLTSEELLMFYEA